MFEPHVCSGPVGRRVGDGVSADGFCGVKLDWSRRRVGDSDSCRFPTVHSALVAQRLLTMVTSGVASPHVA